MKLAANNSGPLVASDARQALLAQVHIARKQLAIDDDDYRELMQRVTGHSSAKECSVGELRAAVANFERLGFHPTGRAKRRDLGSGATIRKARAMWISLYQLGAIEDGSDTALEAFGKRQLRVDRLRWASERDGFRLIEALKAIADRCGWDQRVSSRLPAADRIRLLKDRLVAAQLARLARAGVPATGAVAGDRAGWSDKCLERAAAELANQVRTLPRENAEGGEA